MASAKNIFFINMFVLYKKFYYFCGVQIKKKE